MGLTFFADDVQSVPHELETPMRKRISSVLGNNSSALCFRARKVNVNHSD